MLSSTAETEGVSSSAGWMKSSRFWRTLPSRGRPCLSSDLGRRACFPLQSLSAGLIKFVPRLVKAALGGNIDSPLNLIT